MSRLSGSNDKKQNLSNLRAALVATMQCTQAVMRATDETLLMEHVCAIIVDAGYCFCWVGAAEQDGEKTVRPLAWAGFEDGYLSSVKITWSDSELGRGPVGTAIQTAKPVVFQDLKGSSDYIPWQTEASKRGYRSCTALPMMAKGVPFAVLSIYAPKPGVFGEAELELLSNLADILSFGITTLRQRQKTEAVLKEHIELIQQVISATPSGLLVCDRDLRCQMWNPSMEQLTGLPAKEAVGGFPFEKLPILPQLGLEAGVQKALAGEVYVSGDVPLTARWGETPLWISCRYVPLGNSFGQITRVLVTLRDVTERRQEEQANRKSELRLRQAARVSHMGIFEHDHRTDALYWSPEQREIFGFDPDEPATLSAYFDLVHPEDREAISAAVRRAHDPGGDGFFDVENRIVLPDGSVRYLTTRSQTFFEGEGVARHKVYTVGAMLDVTDRRRMEEERQKLVEVVQNSPDLIGIATTAGKVMFINRAGQELVGIENDQEATSIAMSAYVAPGQMRRLAHEVLPMLLSGKPWWGEVLLKHLQSGESIPVEMRAFPICDTQGTVMAIANVSRDIRGRRKFEEALRQAEQKYRGIFDNAVLGIFQSTPDGRYLSVNQAMAGMHGYASPQEMMSEITNIDRQVFVDSSQHSKLIGTLEKQGVVHNFVFEICRKDGSRGWASVNAREIRDDQGKLVCYEGTQEDITERKLLEAQYQQAQKMEAVGRLAGGVAHDFNNILGVIMGYCDLTMEQVPFSQPLTRNISEIKEAAARAAVLTKQLLAFSKQQMLNARVLDLNKLVLNVAGMLKRLVGEDIALSLKAGDRLRLIKVNPGQIEQILMNLVVNARDAMPAGGDIVIETSNVYLDDSYARQHAPVIPGSYVMISVADTGCGIDKETLSRIFEPFFTTKASGKGTGLGLATVYGIVKQSNGYIWAYSEPSKGAIFKIYFPAVEDKETELEPEVATETKGGSETILLVEDEEALRDVAATLLEVAGYKILKAENATVALALARTREIDLVITDVIMPNMSGPELCSRIREERSGIRFLYVSGYAGDKLTHYVESAPAVSLVEKPFTKESLLNKVRSVLDS
ncbi:MAG: PAS domain S-box protein [Terriglobales bacterium]